MAKNTITLRYNLRTNKNTKSKSLLKNGTHSNVLLLERSGGAFFLLF